MATYFARLNAHDGVVLDHGHVEAGESVPVGATAISEDHHATLVAEMLEGRQCRMVNGVLQHLPPPNPSIPSLATLKANARDRVDFEADAARRRVVGGKEGFEREQAALVGEARRLAAAQDTPRPENYPLLAADCAAFAALGPVPALEAVAEAALRQEAAWVRAFAEIRRIRMTARLMIEQADTPEQLTAMVATMAALTWPELNTG